jgi:hypothetical protein
MNKMFVFENGDFIIKIGVCCVNMIVHTGQPLSKTTKHKLSKKKSLRKEKRVKFAQSQFIFFKI